MTSAEIKRHMLVDVARSFLSVREMKTNWSPIIEMFQKEVNGKAEREPWCCCFAQYCVAEVDRRFALIDGVSPRSILYRSELVLDVWKKTSFFARTEDPTPGMLMLWQHFKDGKPTGGGHVGIIQGVDRGVAIRYRVVEGNTGMDSPDGSVNREGDGVFEKYRLPVGSDSMRVLGYIDPWASVDIPEGASKL